MFQGFVFGPYGISMGSVFSNTTNTDSSAVRLHQPSVANSCERPIVGADKCRKPGVVNKVIASRS